VYGHLAKGFQETNLAPWRALPFLMAIGWISVIVFVWNFQGEHPPGTFTPILIQETEKTINGETFKTKTGEKEIMHEILNCRPWMVICSLLSFEECRISPSSGQATTSSQLRHLQLPACHSRAALERCRQPYSHCTFPDRVRSAAGAFPFLGGRSQAMVRIK
jgi:hypothetical protein